MRGWLLALSLARGLDVTSTCLALQRGGVELNPLLPGNCRAQIGMQLGATIAQGWALEKLHATHPKLAKVIGSIAISIEVGGRDAESADPPPLKVADNRRLQGGAAW